MDTFLKTHILSFIVIERGENARTPFRLLQSSQNNFDRKGTAASNP